MMLKLLLSAFVLSISAYSVLAHEIIGKVTHVRDADTIEVNDTPIRFNGVDAPDKGQANYYAGKEWMQNNYLGRKVKCILTGAKTYDHWVGTCYGSKGENISVRVIGAGLPTVLGWEIPKV